MKRSATARAVAALIAAVALAVLAAACSGSPSGGSGSSPGAGKSANDAAAVSFSHCMRSHGVPNYPDPASNGSLPKTSPQYLGVSATAYSAARTACQHLLPTQGGTLTAATLRQCYLALVCPQALVQHAMSAGLQFARCMRAHGVQNWPDPTIDSEGRPSFNITVPRPPPPKTKNAINECSRLDHAGSLLAWG